MRGLLHKEEQRRDVTIAFALIFDVIIIIIIALLLESLSLDRRL